MFVITDEFCCLLPKHLLTFCNRVAHNVIHDGPLDDTSVPLYTGFRVDTAVQCVRRMDEDFAEKVTEIKDLLSALAVRGKF
jgi:hypothetical protein